MIYRESGNIYLYIWKTLFSTRPSDLAHIWHTCADRDETGSHLKKIDTPHPILIETRLNRRSLYRPEAAGRPLWTNQLCANPRRVATVLSHQPFPTSPLDGNSALDHHHVLELQVVSTIHLKGSSRRHPSRSTKGKTVRAHSQYTSDRQYTAVSAGGRCGQISYARLRFAFWSYASLCFTFWGSSTLSTSTHRRYDESVHRIKQLTRGNNTIPYHIRRL